MTKKQDQKLTNTQLKLLKIISYYMGISPSKTVYLPLELICSELGIRDRQFRRLKKEMGYIFYCKWRKATNIDGIVRKNVYVFKQVGNIHFSTSDLKVSKCPTSNKEEKNSNKNIDLRSESSFNFKNSYSKAKSLSDMIPVIDNEICNKLRSKSGRHFSDNFIIQLVLKLSKNPKITPTFNYLKGFIAYMAKALQYEKHDAVKTGNINFRFKDNIPVNNNEHQEQQKTSEPLELPDGIWGDVCKKLVDIHGQCVYKNWFSKLTPIINKENKTVELKAPNSFIQQWVEDNYSDAIKALAKILEFNFKGIRIQQYFDNVTLDLNNN